MMLDQNANVKWAKSLGIFARTRDTVDKVIGVSISEGGHYVALLVEPKGVVILEGDHGTFYRMWWDRYTGYYNNGPWIHSKAIKVTN